MEIDDATLRAHVDVAVRRQRAVSTQRWRSLLRYRAMPAENSWACTRPDGRGYECSATV